MKHHPVLGPRPVPIVRQENSILWRKWCWHSLKVGIIWLVVLLYLVFPVTLLLAFRGPEIVSTVGMMDEPMLYVVGGVAIVLLMTRKFGWLGFILCLAIGIDSLRESMDVRLWKPPVETDLSGKVCVVTGANRGLGLSTAKALASFGAHVVLTCRSVDRCQNAVDIVNGAGSAAGGSASSAVLRLQSLESAYVLARQLTTDFPEIHYLFNNAGSTPHEDLTEEVLENGFGGMHLAHMALTLGLLPSLRKAGETSDSPARIVMTSSDMAITSACGIFGSEPFRPDFMKEKGEGDLRGEYTRGDGNTWSSLAAYGRAKLCNVLFTFELNRRMREQKWPVVIHAVHTGSVQTYSASNGVGSLFRQVPGLPFVVSKLFAPLLWRSPDQGARTLLCAALSNDPLPMIEGGQYVNAMCQPVQLPQNDDIASFEQATFQLWGNKTLTMCKDRWEALKASDIKWASRLWNVSLLLLENSPARGVVKNAP